MAKDVSYVEVYSAMRRAPNGKAPGPIKFWKLELKRRKHSKDEKKHQPKGPKAGEGHERLCIAALMTKVFEDIERLRTVGTQFSEGRMGLLYKKKDKREIQTYRPITLLNTDYKPYTKVITKRLREVTPNVIHEDQARFMPKRSIDHQTKIVELMIKWCKNTKNNSMIVCLDQEKAYDRIDPQYLWKSLEAFSFPDPFIRRMKDLYRNPATAICINGFVSELRLCLFCIWDRSINHVNVSV